MHHVVHCREGDAGGLQQLGHARERAHGRILGGGQALVQMQPPARGVGQDEVREGAADVEADAAEGVRLACMEQGRSSFVYGAGRGATVPEVAAHGPSRCGTVLPGPPTHDCIGCGSGSCGAYRKRRRKYFDRRGGVGRGRARHRHRLGERASGTKCRGSPNDRSASKAPPTTERPPPRNGLCPRPRPRSPRRSGRRTAPQRRVRSGRVSARVAPRGRRNPAET